MTSKRKLAMKAKRAAKHAAQLKPGARSRYALKVARVAGGWNNPRSPIRAWRDE